MIRFFYNLLFPLVLLGFLPAYLVKMLRRGSYREKFGQRLGFYDRTTRERLAADRRTWVHAVSVGEVIVALKLAATMKQTEPALHVALTTTTTTGFALATRDAPDWLEVLYTPLDFWPIMRRAFAVIRPFRIILVEAEVWPNMTALADQRKIPLALVNARLSPRSEGRFRRFRLIVRPIFARLTLVCVQEPADVARWESLGVSPARIYSVGSIKFDPVGDVPDAKKARTFLDQIGIDPARPILLAGSTHDGEEEILAQVFQQLREEFRDLFLIIAPRHVERAREVESDLRALGLTTTCRSTPARNADVLLLDTTGELRNWYPLATIVFIGKSLTARGGQNPVEAIVADRPVVFGPHMENFSPLAEQLLNAGGTVQVHDPASLTNAVAALLRDPAARTALVRHARGVLARHRGATARTAELLRQLEVKVA